MTIAGIHPNAEIRNWGAGVERLIGARITQIIGRKIKDRAELGEVLADLRQLVALGRVGTVAIGFALTEGGEILVQDFPIARP